MRSNLKAKLNPKSTFGGCFGFGVLLKRGNYLKINQSPDIRRGCGSGLRSADHSPSTMESGQRCYALHHTRREGGKEDKNK